MSIEVLTHGASYNRTYWDWPTYAPLLSYVKAALGAGRATLSYDRLGTGRSSRPPAAGLDVPTAAWVLHQVITGLRKPAYGFANVTSTGHSIGSEVVQFEAAVYQDVERVVLTGLLHRNGEAVPEALASVYPAMFDPKFAGLLTDSGYLTTIPAARPPLFLYTPTTSPQIIAADEENKDVFSGPELGDALGRINAPPVANESRAITAPVLMLIGTEDRMFCGAGLDCSDLSAVRAFETPYFPSSRSFTLYTVPATGHSLTLHVTNPLSALVISAWIHAHP